MQTPLITTDLPLPNRRCGKVRDIYDIPLHNGEPGLLIIATDRVSAFDVVMANGLPGKGKVLTQISIFWFEWLAKQFGDRLSHHLVSTDPADIPGLDDDQRQALRGRIMIGRKLNVIPIECVVRGYLTGSGFKDYQKTGQVCGIDLPSGMVNSSKIDQPIFTPATKAETGHDENISFEQACDVAGESLMTQLRDLSIEIYGHARDYAAERGIIIADTKFEFGMPGDSPGTQPILIDEVFTPDSSRFWPADLYEPGKEQPSMDKQIVRNHLQEICDRGEWDKTPPGPTLPDDVVSKTMAQYRKAYKLLTGSEIEL